MKSILQFTLLILLTSFTTATMENPFLAAAKGTNHAVIIAGSSGFENYRHHADVCHAFKILSENVPRRISRNKPLEVKVTGKQQRFMLTRSIRTPNSITSFVPWKLTKNL